MNRFGFASLVAIVLTIVLMFCAVGCNESDYHKLADANAKISSALGAITDETIQLTNAGELSPALASQILSEIDHALIVNGEFRDRLRQTKQIQPSDRAAIAAWINDIGSSLERLNEDGVLHIKNPDTQQKFATAVAAAKAAVAVVGSIVTSEVNVGSKDGDVVTARSHGGDGSREAGRRDQSTIGNDGRATARLGGVEGRGHARESESVPGTSGSGTVVIQGETTGAIVIEFVRKNCADVNIEDRDWQTGRCRLRA